MATLNSIVNSAFRESGIVAIGVTPDTNEASEALAHLQNIISSLSGFESGEMLTPVDVGQNGVQYPPINYNNYQYAAYLKEDCRLLCNLSQSTTLYLPPVPNDGATMAAVDLSGNFATYPLIINGNGRQIEGAPSVTLNTNGQSKSWLYRDDLGSWALVSPLTGTSNSPYPSMYDELLTIMLCKRINPRYGAETAPETEEVYKRLIRHFQAQYRQEREKQVEDGLIRLPGQRKFFPISYTNNFTRGY